MTPPDEPYIPTPHRGHRALDPQPAGPICPRCGYELGPLAHPAEKVEALERKPTTIAKPNDETAPFPLPGDRRYAPTERMDLRDPKSSG